MTRSTRSVLSTLLALLLAGCGGGSSDTASTGPTASPSPPLSASGSFFALSVADIDATSTWYADNLGLRIALRPTTSNRAQVVVLEGDGLIVELLQQEGSLPLSRVAPAVHDRMLVRGIVKVGMTVDDLDAAAVALRARGVPIAFGPFPSTAEQRANLIIRDNEGNLIQLLGK